MTLSFFKAYDVRGKLGSELNNDIAERIGRAFGEWLKPETVVVGGDIRYTSMVLKAALVHGLRKAGVNVLDIGLCGTEEIYFATSHFDAGGGIMVTASHNPLDYNGMKFVREGSRPISGDSGLKEIAKLVELDAFAAAKPTGNYRRVSCFDEYLVHLLSYINTVNLKPLKIVVNPGNGSAGPVLNGLESKLPLEFVYINQEPDGSFPNGIPNPLLPENRDVTAKAVIENGADFGLAWDGDFDRCFFFDHKGQFIEGYYIVGLLAEAFLRKHPGEKIIHDPRLTWNTQEICNEFGGLAIQSKCGHAFIKEKMREEDAIYGGEMSAHHYFRDFFYCDSGMIPWLLISELLSTTDTTLCELVESRMAKYPCSGEINRHVASSDEVLAAIEEQYGAIATSIDKSDGLGISFEDWRFNLRASNTEPVIRLNVEATSQSLVEQKVTELLAEIN